MPANSRLSVLALALGLGLATGALACDDEDDEIGTPCESDEDCSGDLICDVHDGQGTCQHEHGHRIDDEDPERWETAEIEAAQPDA